MDVTFPFFGPTPQEEAAEAARLDAWVSAVNIQMVERLAALIREVDGDHSLGPAALAEELVKRGVTVQLSPHGGPTASLNSP
ncbi:Uncharacterised protein [Mycobacteroides abscessus subsp. bolletii]|uniref:hypothetical protein n=1 Tax=Mycobacteroides abscessus TaxID=36809 RepID=UPI0009A7E8B1|nr:hypothetical protein [Mycobacteroides abscessus]SKY96894.1 Uncharacterised protein [Mycobacteroides abscessus subsp. bolletii]